MESSKQVWRDPIKTPKRKDIYMKTLADLKRDSKTGKLFGTMILWCGSTEIPERLSAKRQIIDANSVAIFFKMQNGKKSELRIERASLLEYTDETLTVYASGYRDLNKEEQQVKNEWEEIANRIENIKQREIDMLTDGSQMFYKQKAFYHNKGYSYLMGLDEEKGMKYDYSKQMIRDKNIKGNIDLQYRLSWEN